MMDSNKSSEDSQPSHQMDPVTHEEDEPTQQMDELHLEETTVTPITWNDAIFTEKFLPMAKVSDKVTTADAIPAAKALLNWYIHGIKPNYSSDAILFVFYAMDMSGPYMSNDNNEKVFPSILMEGETPLKKPDETEKIEDIRYQSPICLPLKSNSSSLSKSSKKNKSAVPETAYSIEVVKHWYTTLWEALDQNSENMDEISKQTQQQAINLIGFLYMNLQRLTIRSKNNVCEHLILKVFDSFSHIWSIISNEMIVNRIILPTSEMISDFINDYKQFSTNSMRCLASIVAAFGNAQKNPNDLFRINRIVNAGCLYTLNKVDLGILHWIEKAQGAESMLKLPDLLQYMNAKKIHHETNMAIIDLSARIWSRKEYSWYWARLFSNEAFPKLDIKDNPEYAMTMFSVSIKNDPKNSLWDILFARFDSTGKTKRAALRMGIHIELGLQSNYCALFEPAQSILKSGYEDLVRKKTRILMEIDNDSS